MNQQLLDTIVATCIRRGLSWLGYTVGGVGGFSEDWVTKVASAAVSLGLLVGNEVWQARKLHQTAKMQGGILPPLK